MLSSDKSKSRMTEQTATRHNWILGEILIKSLFLLKSDYFPDLAIKYIKVLKCMVGRTQKSHPTNTKPVPNRLGVVTLMNYEK